MPVTSWNTASAWLPEPVLPAVDPALVAQQEEINNYYKWYSEKSTGGRKQIGRITDLTGQDDEEASEFDSELCWRPWHQPKQESKPRVPNSWPDPFSGDADSMTLPEWKRAIELWQAGEPGGIPDDALASLFDACGRRASALQAVYVMARSAALAS